MRLAYQNFTEGKVTLTPEWVDDLWELSHLITQGDLIRAKTERKIAVGGDRAKQVRKPMTLTIEVTQVELEGDMLRIQGLIREGPEDLISFGDHHGLSVQQGTELTIQKEWDTYMQERLKKAATAKPMNILIVLFDREKAIFAELTRRGHEVLNELSGDVSKKAPGGGEENFWKTLAQVITELDQRKQYKHIVAASPAFWNDYLLKALPQEIQKKTTGVCVSEVTSSAVGEILKRTELTQVLAHDQESTEHILLEKFFSALADEKACYGIEECKEKIAIGQVAITLVTKQFIEKTREERTFTQLDLLLEKTKSNGGEVHIFERVTDRLNGIGGIAGILRW